MRNSRMPISLADAQVTLSGVMHAQPAGVTHLPLAEALQLSLDVVRLVAKTHDAGKVIGVLDAAHLICLPDGALTFGGAGGNPIAPELKRGDAPDRLSDVYALGAVIYRLLTGHRVETARFVEPPSHFNPAVDSALDELVLQALDEDPSERPYSARELERQLLEVFEELGLEPGGHADVSKLMAAPAPAPAAPVAPKKKPVVELDDDDDDVPERPQGVSGFLYDLGFSPPAGRSEPSWAKRPLLGDDEPLSTSEHSKPRNKLSQFMYDNGMLQGIDWDAPATLMWLKRGGIAFAALLLLVIVWPSSKEPKLNAAQKALVSQSVKADAPAPTVKAKPAVVVKQTSKPTRANGRR